MESDVHAQASRRAGIATLVLAVYTMLLIAVMAGIRLKPLYTVGWKSGTLEFLGHTIDTRNKWLGVIAITVLNTGLFEYAFSTLYCWFMNVIHDPKTTVFPVSETRMFMSLVTWIVYGMFTLIITTNIVLAAQIDVWLASLFTKIAVTRLMLRHDMYLHQTNFRSVR